MFSKLDNEYFNISMHVQYSVLGSVTPIIHTGLSSDNLAPPIVSCAPDSEKSLVTLAVFPCAGVRMLTPRSDWSSHMITGLITYLR